MASEMLANSPPDGYTALMVTSSHTVNAAARKTLRFDPIADFAPVSLAGSTPDLLVVNADSPIRSLADLIAAAKKAPGKITYGSSGPGTLSQLEAELLKSGAGIDLLHVPYKGGIPAVTALIGNEINLLFLGTVGLAPQIRAGKLRAIAITSKKRSPLFPNVPTMIESGFPGFETGIWYGLMVPAKTPPAVIAKLNKRVNDALKQPDVRQRLVTAGIDPLGTTPAQFETVIKDDIARWQKLVEQSPQLRIED
jgi:tripartite-type tricarboxylate transporter receptor subunit TctC